MQVSCTVQSVIPRLAGVEEGYGSEWRGRARQVLWSGKGVDRPVRQPIMTARLSIYTEYRSVALQVWALYATGRRCWR